MLDNFGSLAEQFALAENQQMEALIGVALANLGNIESFDKLIELGATLNFHGTAHQSEDFARVSAKSLRLVKTPKQFQQWARVALMVEYRSGKWQFSFNDSPTDPLFLLAGIREFLWREARQEGWRFTTTARILLLLRTLTVLFLVCEATLEDISIIEKRLESKTPLGSISFSLYSDEIGRLLSLVSFQVKRIQEVLNGEFSDVRYEDKYDWYTTLTSLKAFHPSTASWIEGQNALIFRLIDISPRTIKYWLRRAAEKEVSHLETAESLLSLCKDNPDDSFLRVAAFQRALCLVPQE